MKSRIGQKFKPTKKSIIIGAVCLSLIMVAIIGVRLLLPSYMGVDYLYRVIVYGDSQVTDWQKAFPKRDIANDANAVSTFASSSQNDSAVRAWSSIEYTKAGKTAVIGPDMHSFLAGTDTDSFLVITQGRIVFEQYLNATSTDTPHTSMSAAKSFVSALTGVAIQEGFIGSVDDRVVQYLPELKGKITEEMTIKHLLTMSAGNEYDDTGGITGDNTKTYWSPNLREVVLQDFRSGEAPGLHMHYNDMQSQALGMILERATGMSIARYLQESIWKPAGMECAASWSLDSEESGFEQSAVGLNACTRDFARFGLLYLNNGVWNGKQIIPKAWIEQSTRMIPAASDHFKGWHDTDAYGYYWWGRQKSDGSFDFYARGKYGQFVYIAPGSQTVIVRTGSSLGSINDWPGILEQIAASATR